jgi:undecaprenyl-diphosphatase
MSWVGATTSPSDSSVVHAWSAVDGAVQRWFLAHQHPAAERVFYWITVLGGITGMRVVALAGAGYLWYRGRRFVAAGIVFVPVMANLAFNVAKRFYARPRPVGLGGRVDSSYAFPSGHATTAAAVCGTLAYVLWREGFLRLGSALALAVIVPLLVGISRLYLDVHWATDVLGGWCAGLLIAVLSAVVYATSTPSPARSVPPSSDRS